MCQLCVGLPHRSTTTETAPVRVVSAEKCRFSYNSSRTLMSLCMLSVRALGSSFGARECEFIIVERAVGLPCAGFSDDSLLELCGCRARRFVNACAHNTRERRPVCHLGITWDLPFWHGTCENWYGEWVLCVTTSSFCAWRGLSWHRHAGIVETWPNNDLKLMRLYQQCIVWDLLSNNRPSELSRCVKDPSGIVATHIIAVEMKLRARLDFKIFQIINLHSYFTGQVWK
jgi:hypothetical protein